MSELPQGLMGGAAMSTSSASNNLPGLLDANDGNESEEARADSMPARTDRMLVFSDDDLSDQDELMAKIAMTPPSVSR